MKGPQALRKSWLAVLLAALSVSVGCHTLFGEFEIEDAPAEPSTLCTEGSFRCVGPWLYTCGADLNSWTEVAACQTEAHCDSRLGICRSCVPESHRCAGKTLEVCNQQHDWVAVVECASEHECNLNSDSCRPCNMGEYQCNQASLMRCTANKTWELVQECMNVASCVVTENRLSGSCNESTCDAGGMHQCNGAQLLRCTNARHRLVELDTCLSPELCDAAAANQQASQNLLATCLTTCTPEAARCVGAELQICNSNGNGWSMAAVCPTAEECNTTARACTPCTPGATECNDAELRRCGSDATWEVLANCGTSQFCDAANGSCVDQECSVPHQTRCRPDGLYRCELPDLKWDLVTVCNGDLCNANDGKCDATTCNEGATRCVENSFQRCSSGLDAWEVVETCGSDETCQLPTGCTPETCTAGQYRCNDVYLEACNEAGAWQRTDRCATSALCNQAEGRCEPPECGGTIGEFRCVSQYLQRCLEDRTDWDDIAECSADGLSCDASTGTCI